MTEPRRHIAFSAVSLALSLGFALVLVEGLFRVFGFPFDESWTRSENGLARFDPELGWTYVPGLTTTRDFPDPEGGAAPRAIALSFDPDLAARVASPAARIDLAAPSVVFVGGSFTMGHGATWDESYVGRIGAALPSLQVVNLGVQGYGTDQALLSLRRHARRFSDLRAVVYGFIPRHVYRDAHADRRLLVRTAHFIGTTPRFDLARDGSLRLAERPVRYQDAGPYSRVAAAARVVWVQYGPVPSLALTHALVSEMRREAGAHGARFLVLEWNPGNDAAHWRDDGGSLFEGVDVTTIRADSGAPPDFDDWRIPGDGHPTPAAHAHVASLLVDVLRELAPR